jgi:hypothetical protein
MQTRLYLSSIACLLRVQRLRGCIFAEDPSVGAPAARLLWAADFDLGVLKIDAVPAAIATNDSFDLKRFSPMVTVVRNTAGGEHIGISDGYRRIRIDVVSGSMLDSPVLLRHHLEGVERLDQKLISLRRLIALHRHGRFVSSLFPVSPQTKRFVTALRVYDALHAGAAQRDIAIALFGKNVVNDDWAGTSDYLRLRVRRLIGLARRMATGEWTKLLA